MTRTPLTAELRGAREELGEARQERRAAREQLAALGSKLDLLRSLMERKMGLLRLELLDELTTLTKMEAIGGRAPLETRLDALRSD